MLREFDFYFFCGDPTIFFYIATLSLSLSLFFLAFSVAYLSVVFGVLNIKRPINLLARENA